MRFRLSSSDAAADAADDDDDGVMRVSTEYVTLFTAPLFIFLLRTPSQSLQCSLTRLSSSPEVFPILHRLQIQLLWSHAYPLLNPPFPSSPTGSSVCLPWNLFPP